MRTPTRRRATTITPAFVVIAFLVIALVAVSACTAKPHPPKARVTGPASASGSQHADTSSRPASSSASSTAPQPALTATTINARLPQPLSRLVAVRMGTGIVIAGGLDAGQRTTNRIEVFDPTTGTMRGAGQLATPVHDAAAGIVAGKAIVAGGGAAASTDAVQQLQANGNAATIGHLPQVRSDDAVATSNDTLYVVGGYDGRTELPGVLATNDGVSFRELGRLAVTVRYGTAYASGHSLWVFGGEHGGVPIPDIQRVDTDTGASSVVAKLPHPLAHAAVVQLGSQILVVGGTDGHNPQNVIYAFDTSKNSVDVVGSLPESVSDMATAVVGDTAYVIGGEALTAEQTLAPTAAIVAVKQRNVSAHAQAEQTGTRPFEGKLLIADRGNNRLLLVDANGVIHWTFPNAQAAAPPSGFYFPDDAFFVDNGKAIISNQEGNDTIVKIAFPGGKSLWSYGHPGKAGTGAGFLHEPDDAYQLRDGRVVVADANNCRVVIASPQGKQIGQIGTTGSCVHKPPTSLGYPNGDTPLQDGNLLISEVDGSWVSEYTLTGSLVWTVHLPIVYPSDPQQIGADKYIVADYARPGGIVEFDRAGHILWDYHVASGHGMLDHPSLAEVLPSGLICVNDDYRHRVVLIDPATKRIVWQYGLDDVSGTAPGLLNTPDGFDLLAPDGTTPTHPWTG